MNAPVPASDQSFEIIGQEALVHLEKQMNGSSFSKKSADIRQFVSRLTSFLSIPEVKAKYPELGKWLDDLSSNNPPRTYGTKSRILVRIFSFFLVAMRLDPGEIEKLEALAGNESEEVIPNLRRKIKEVLSSIKLQTST